MQISSRYNKLRICKYTPLFKSLETPVILYLNIIMSLLINVYNLDLNNISQAIRWLVSFKYFGKKILLNDK